MKNIIKRIRLFFFIAMPILLLIMINCAVPPGRVSPKDGKFPSKKKKQWKVQWMKYYQKGYSSSQEHYWDFAARDLKDAIKLRPLDQRWMGPHGLQIEDEYFPHRELGIVYYQQKRFEEAIGELEISLRQFESAKAKYFLNLAREDYLQETGEDRFPPQIDIKYPQSGLLTGSSSLTISGEVKDDQYVKSLFINDEEIPIEISEPSIEFQRDITLKRGENRIDIEVMDLVGKKTQKEIVIWCDWRAPIIYIDRIEEDSKNRTGSIEGYVSDFSGVAGFWLNGSRVDFLHYREGEFSIQVPVSSMKAPLKFNAEDILGNHTSGKIDISEIIGQADSENPIQTRLAFMGQNPEGLIASSLDSEPDASKKRIDSGPIIRLKEMPDRLTVDWGECFLEGEVRDLAGIKSLIINGVSLINRTGRIVFFNFKMPLEVGENEITIQAESLSGEAATKKLSIERKLNKVRKVGSRLKLALIPFKYLGERSEIKDMLYDALIQNFIQGERFQIVEREKIRSFLNQAKTEEEEDSQPFIELGRAITAEGIMVGSAYFENDYLEIIARVIDTETTVILDSEEVFGPVESLKDIQFLAEGLSIKFKQAFPLLEGHVVNVDDASVQIDLGEKDLILPFMKVVFFREDEPLRLPGSEMILEKRFITLGEGRIKKVYESISDVDLLSKEGHLQVNLNDQVITK